MANNFRIEAHTEEAKARLLKIKSGLTRTGVDRVVNRVAHVTHMRLVTQTPKKWTGQTRRSWRVIKRGAASYQVTNISKVMRFLEMGTRAHGPKKAKRLFIPINRKGALAGPRLVFANSSKYKVGKDFILAKRVKGIKAMKIVANQRRMSHITMRAAMRLHIRKLME